MRLRRAGIWAARVGAVLAFLAAWQVACLTVLRDSTVLASPVEVAGALPSVFDAETLDGLAVTAREYALAMLIAAGLGVTVGSVAAASRVASDALTSVMAILIAVPLVAIYPVLALAFGIGPTSKVIIGVISALPPIVVATVGGVRRVDPSLRDAVRAMGGGRRAVVLRAALPGALPEIIGGLSLGASFGLVGIVLGELLSAQAGIGPVVNQLALTFQPAKLIAVVGVVCLASVIVITALNALEEWQRRRTSST